MAGSRVFRFCGTVKGWPALRRRAALAAAHGVPGAQGWRWPGRGLFVCAARRLEPGRGRGVGRDAASRRIGCRGMRPAGDGGAAGRRGRPAAGCGPGGAGKKKSRASGPARVNQVGMSVCSVLAPTGHCGQTSQTGAEEEHGGGLGDGGRRGNPTTIAISTNTLHMCSHDI